MRIEVTEDHIRRGKAGDGLLCPIACAISEQLPTLVDPMVTDERLSWGFTGARVGVDLPDVASEFVFAFDNGDLVDPFSFELALPESTLAQPLAGAA